MASGSFTQTKSGIEMSLMPMLTRGKSVASFLQRVIFPQYQQAQIDRWTSENSSQGETWKPLTLPYERYKKKKFAAYPGSGNALMVATGRLASGAQARDQAYFFKNITDKQFQVSINTGALPYASYPGVMRPYMKFNEETVKNWTSQVSQYVMKGREP